MAKGQRKRNKKVSKGLSVGARKSPQTPLNLILMGKGLYRNFKLSGKGNRFSTSPNTHEPFDPVQAKKNRDLYPHLDFTD